MHTVKWFQVLLCITSNSIEYQSFAYAQLNDKTVLFLTIQFSISHLLAQLKCQTVLFDPSGASTPGQSGSWSDCNEEVLCIPQSSGITGASPSDTLVSYLGHSLRRRVLLHCRDTVGVFYSPNRLTYSSNLRGPYPQALTLLERARFIAWCLWHWRGSRHFWKCGVCVGYGSVPGSHNKKGLVSYACIGGALDKYQDRIELQLAPLSADWMLVGISL